MKLLGASGGGMRRTFTVGFISSKNPRNSMEEKKSISACCSKPRQPINLVDLNIKKWH
jgi:hypothetical protein